MNSSVDSENKIQIPKKQKEMSFQGFFSLSGWKAIGQVIMKYLHGQEELFKLIGVTVAISGLFLSLKSEDISLRRLEVFFILASSILISYFVIKSLYKLSKGKH